MKLLPVIILSYLLAYITTRQNIPPLNIKNMVVVPGGNYIRGLDSVQRQRDMARFDKYPS